MVERLKMSILYTSGWKIKNINIIHKWAKGLTCEYYTPVVYTSG